MQCGNILQISALLFAISFGPSEVQAACSVDNHHPENGGYYIEGIKGIISSQRDTVSGRRADNTTWAANTYYPHGEMKLCTGMFCSEASKVNGTAQYVVAHTCALLRFSYASSSGSTVYEMPDLDSFTTCDFTNAFLRGAADAGSPHYDYVIEDDHSKKVYYFASKDQCANGQKVAVEVVDDYANNALQCKNMGAGSSRIQHCDCNHQLKGTTLIDPCHTAFANACVADMPSDTSCCPGASASYTDRKYVNGGTCIPKSKEQSMRQTYLDTIDLCAKNATKCSEFEALTSCPSKYDPANHDPRCNMQKTLKQCEGATGAMVETCRTDMNWIVANVVKSAAATTGTTGTTGHGHGHGTTGTTTGHGHSHGTTGTSTGATATGQVTTSGAKCAILDGIFKPFATVLLLLHTLASN